MGAMHFGEHLLYAPRDARNLLWYAHNRISRSVRISCQPICEIDSHWQMRGQPDAQCKVNPRRSARKVDASEGAMMIRTARIITIYKLTIIYYHVDLYLKCVNVVYNDWTQRSVPLRVPTTHALVTK